ncbi:hypothetical protein B0H13DRAFT_993766 [Mycena leptocephala]|nr:hypothetical protein B0H13DRAFT_993766 [Mycena leptocephala]
MPSVALSSPSPSSAASKAPASPIVPIIVAAVAALLLVSAMLLTFHFRRQNKKKMDTARAARKGREVQAGETVLRTHPATLMVLPPHGEGNPRFVHTPGTNMRIATRRADGAWEFADPRAPFTPAIIADASDAALPANRNSAVSTAESSSDPSHNSPYSYASYGDQTPGSSSQLLPPPTAASASPWGAPTTPLTADMDISARSPWRSAHSPTPSTSASTFLPAPSIATDSRRGSTVSSNDSFLDLDARSTHSNPFLSPASTAPSRGARWPASPAASARSSPNHPRRLPPRA